MGEASDGPPDRWSYNLRDLEQGIRRKLAEGVTTRVFPGERLMFSVVNFEPGAMGRIHSHPEEQWGLLLEGSCVRIQDGEERAMAVEDFWRTPSGVPHGLRAGPSGAVVLDVFSPPRPEYTRAGEGFGDAQGG